MKKIAFFSVGFAFNRLVRLKYYERIFPRNVELHLFTTNRYGDSKKWTLDRTKIHILEYNALKIFPEIRRYCKEKKITSLSNLGHPFGAIPLIFSSLLSDRKVLLFFLGDSIDVTKRGILTKSGIRYFFRLIPYFFLEKFSEKVAFVGYNSYKRAPNFFLSKKEKFHFLHAPVNTSTFFPKNKFLAREILGIERKKKVILYVGRVTPGKGAYLLAELIKLNPDISFIIIGEWGEKVPRLKAKNLKKIKEIPNEKLVDYYCAADLVFAYHLHGCQLNLVAAEALSCGTPILHSKTMNMGLPESEAIIRIDNSANLASKQIKSFFSKPESQRKKIGAEAREYAEKYLSEEVWKERYLNFFFA